MDGACYVVASLEDWCDWGKCVHRQACVQSHPSSDQWHEQSCTSAMHKKQCWTERPIPYHTIADTSDMTVHHPQHRTNLRQSRPYKWKRTWQNVWQGGRAICFRSDGFQADKTMRRSFGFSRSFRMTSASWSTPLPKMKLCDEICQRSPCLCSQHACPYTPHQSAATENRRLGPNHPLPDALIRLYPEIPSTHFLDILCGTCKIW